MWDVNLALVLYESIGTAEGRCLGCGAYFYVAVPNDGSAKEALSRLFDKHLAEIHAEKKQIVMPLVDSSPSNELSENIGIKLDTGT
jgi:hypothetical protein